MAEITLPGGTVLNESGTVRPATLPRHITEWAFRKRMTLTERINIEFASLDNPAGTMEQRLQAAAIRTHLADLAGAAYVDLDMPELAAGMATLEAVGLLASGRAAEILGADVQDAERP